MLTSLKTLTNCKDCSQGRAQREGGMGLLEYRAMPSLRDVAHEIFMYI
jgi:hypothetical protein